MSYVLRNGGFFDVSMKKRDEVKDSNISENQILDNNKIKVYMVESRINIYNDIVRVMANKLKENNQKETVTSFILPVGSRGQYKRFARICNTEKISCKNLITINMDEYLDNNDNYIPEDHPLSFRGFMKENLFKQLNDDLKIKPENIYFPDPNSTSQIEKVINEIGGVDICFGGVGINRHVAFNEPIDENLINCQEFRELRTRTLKVSTETIIMSSIKYVGNLDLVPRNCVTIEIKEIFSSKKLRFYLEHDWQSEVLKKILYMEPSLSFPASYLKEHDNVLLTVSRNVLKNFDNFEIENNDNKHN